MARSSTIVGRLPPAAFDRSSADEHIRRHSVFYGSRVDKWFVSRSCLPEALSRIVELVRLEIIAADHCDDLAVLGVDRDDGCLNFRHLREFDLKSLILIINRFYEELREKSRFQFLFWPLAAPPHVCSADYRSIPAESNTYLIGISILRYHQSLYVLAFLVFVPVPVGMLIRL